CPFCINIAPEKIEHMLLECSRWQVLCVKTTLATANDLNIKTAVARTRAFGKWASLRTWISDLIKCPYKHRSDTEAARRYAKSGFIKKKFIEECPFCRNIAPETIEHMLLECSRWQALRADILAQYINIYRAQVAKPQHNCLLQFQ
ncbi:hypothetical protein BB561_006114, partial [Smittium simulii]